METARANLIDPATLEGEGPVQLGNSEPRPAWLDESLDYQSCIEEGIDPEVDPCLDAYPLAF